MLLEFEDTGLWSVSLQIAQHPTAVSGESSKLTKHTKAVTNLKEKQGHRQSEQTVGLDLRSTCLRDLHRLQARFVEVHVAHRF